MHYTLAASAATRASACDDIAVHVCIALRRQEGRLSLSQAGAMRAATGLGTGLTSEVLSRASAALGRSDTRRDGSGGHHAVTMAMRDEAAWILASAQAPLSPEAAASMSTAQLVALRYLSRRCDDVIRFAGVAVDLSRCTSVAEGLEGASAGRAMRDSSLLVQHVAEQAVRGAVSLGERLSAVMPEAAVRPVTTLLVQKCEALVTMPDGAGLP